MSTDYLARLKNKMDEAIKSGDGFKIEMIKKLLEAYEEGYNSAKEVILSNK